MSKNRTVALAIALALPGARLGAQATSAPRSLHFGVAAGVTIPRSDVVEDAIVETAQSTPSYHLSVLAEYATPRHPVGARLELMYHDLPGKEQRLTSATFGSGEVRYDEHLVAGTANAVVSAPRRAGLQPYLLAGVGLYGTSTTGHYSGALLGGTSSQSQGGTASGLNAGLGAHFPLRGVSAFVEARYHYVLDKVRCDPTNIGRTCFDHDNTAILPVSVGVTF
jgi:opacity protein-like surface antigen